MRTIGYGLRLTCYVFFIALAVVFLWGVAFPYAMLTKEEGW